MNRDGEGLKYLQQLNYVADVALQFLPEQVICNLLIDCVHMLLLVGSTILIRN
jgi:hypothetical protein